MRLRASWAIVALGLTVTACGATEPNRFSLRTPGARTGQAPATPLGTPVPSVTATPTPTRTPAPKPVSGAERRVIQGWSDELRHGRVAAAARYFSVPAMVSNVAPGWEFLETKAAVKKFNAGLPCGAKLLRTRPSSEKGFVVGIFRLTERPGPGTCGTGAGAMAAVAFRIVGRHITRWVRADSEVEEPEPAPKATPEPGPPGAA